MDDPLTNERVKKFAGEFVNLQLLKKALDGDLKAIQLLSERVEGKPSQDMNIGGKSDNPLSIEINLTDGKKQ